MSQRYFSSEPISTGQMTLAGSEAHHILHVMRLRVGQGVTLFDGSGAEFAAKITACGRAEVQLAIEQRNEVNRELAFPLTVCVALPKGDRQKWLVEKLTELGVSSLIPLLTERGVAQPTGTASERLRRSVIEASKQCGRNRLMQIETPRSWGAAMREAVNEEPEAVSTRLVAHPGGTPITKTTTTILNPTWLALGPEGGLTDEEIAIGESAGWQMVDLGPRILRIETAALMLASLVAMGS